jgi:two-component system response regulator CpxR
MRIEKHHILCIEDDQDTCEMLTIALQPAGYEVISAHTATEALRKASIGDFAALLLDTNLPDISGIELCKQIRSFDNATPIIFYSGEARPEMIEEAMKAGAQAYLKKPIDPFEVGETIAGLISTT